MRAASARGLRWVGGKKCVMGNNITRLSKCSCPIALHCPNGYQLSVVRGVFIGLPKGGPRLALAGLMAKVVMIWLIVRDCQVLWGTSSSGRGVMWYG